MQTGGLTAQCRKKAEEANTVLSKLVSLQPYSLQILGTIFK